MLFHEINATIQDNGDLLLTAAAWCSPWRGSCNPIISILECRTMPDLNQYTIHGLTFTAVRKHRPLKHWVAVCPNGAELHSISHESRPKMWADVEYMAEQLERIEPGLFVKEINRWH